VGYILEVEGVGVATFPHRPLSTDKLLGKRRHAATTIPPPAKTGNNDSYNIKGVIAVSSGPKASSLSLV
jgi:hypothetical protein